MRRGTPWLFVLTLAACGGSSMPDGGTPDGGHADAGRDAGTDSGGTDLGGGHDGGEDMPLPCDDSDADGHGAMSCGGDDCDDADPLRYPGAIETCDTVDNDCDPLTVGTTDEDGDGYTSNACCNGATCGDDCDDGNQLAHPTTPEVCDGADNDCNGMIDDGAAPVSWYVDADHDGFGDPSSAPVSSCVLVPGAVPNMGDCDDTQARRNPAAPEVCDGVDNDCDTMVDDDTSAVLWYADGDGDGFGDPTAGTVLSCTPVADHVLNARDCDDTTVSRNPIATETCNGLDDNCNGAIDDGVATSVYFHDADADGSGVAGDTMTSCRPTGEYTASVSGDCDDLNATVHPGASEVCDGIDNDCNGTTDPGCAGTTGVSGVGGTTPETYPCGPGAVMVGARSSYFDACCDGGGDPFATFDADPRALCRSISVSGGVITWGAVFEPSSRAGYGITLNCASDEVVTGIAFHNAPFSDSTSIECTRITGSGSSYVLGVTHVIDTVGGPARPILQCPAGTVGTGLRAYPEASPLGPGDHSGLELTCALPGT